MNEMEQFETETNNIKDEEEQQNLMNSVNNSAKIDPERVEMKIREIEQTSKPLVKLSSSKSKAKSKKGRMTYPTQIMKIGEIKCLFLSCFYQGRSPFLSIGPSWPFTLILLLFAVMAIGYFVFMLSLLKTLTIPVVYGGGSLVCLNILALLMGILKNPGIPQALIDQKLKDKLFGKGGQKNEDLEGGTTQKPQQRKRTIRGFSMPGGYNPTFCPDCNIQRDRGTYHCNDCDVCIENFDHHCVFFSKCIGGGNIICFYATIALVFFVFIAFGGLIIVDSVVAKK